MIDLTNEQLLTFPEAARLLPGQVHVSTLHRWRLRGVRGNKLASLLVGGRRVTSAQAIQRFADGVTAARDGSPLPVRTPNQRQNDIARAELELQQVGV
jgi:hypothetical protein